MSFLLISASAVSVPAGEQGHCWSSLCTQQSSVWLYTDQAGRPGNWGVQLNGDVVSPEQIASRIEELRSGMSAENAEKLTISLRADRRTPMKLINAVKRELQDSYALRINYGAMKMK